MDDVLNKLGSALITPQPLDDKTSSHQACYKNWGRLKNQEARRRETLEIQKS